jgi:hypothetical protein
MDNGWIPLLFHFYNADPTAPDSSALAAVPAHRWPVTAAARIIARPLSLRQGLPLLTSCCSGHARPASRQRVQFGPSAGHGAPGVGRN